jgi:hypothetical protein
MNATDAMFFAPLVAQQAASESVEVTLDIELGGLPATVHLDAYADGSLWVDYVSVGGAEIDAETFAENVLEGWCDEFRAKEAA